MDRSAIYVGHIRHRRHAPVPHEFRYPLFMTLLDVDRIPALMDVSRLTSYERLNLASFYERDHFGDSAHSLRQRLADDARSNGHVLPDGPIYLLTHLRYAGYVFNPISVYYCFDRRERLALVMAEVNNTFGGSRNYWLSPEVAHTSTASRRFLAETSKALYVSPFMADRLDYRFVLSDPAESLAVHITATEPGAPAPMFDATLSLDRRPWTASVVRRALWQYPLMTARVVAGIHWEALRLWWKGVAVVPRSHPRGLTTSARWPAHPLEP